MTYSLQQLLANLLPAQQESAVADPEALKITPGEIAAALMLLCVAGLSIIVGIRWLVRILQHSHPIAAVNRGIPRVPLPLTICTAVITGLLLLLVWLSAGVPQEADIPFPPATATASEPTTASEPAVAETQVENSAEATPENDSKKKPAEAAMVTDSGANQQDSSLNKTEILQAWQMLLSTILMNAFIFVGLGVVLIIAAQSGRYRLDVIQPPAIPPELIKPGSVSTWENLDTDSVNEAGDPASTQAELTPATLEPAAVQPAPPPRFSLLEELACAAEITLAAFFPTMFLRLVLALMIKHVTGEEAPSNPLLDMISSGAGGMLLAVVILTGVVVAPVVEELQFRVVLLGGLLQAGLRRMAVIGAAVSFSLLHGFPDGLALLPLAFALGYAYMRRQSYLTAIFVHFFFNAINLGITFAAMG